MARWSTGAVAHWGPIAPVGYPVTFCIGVHEKDGVIRAHSWITLGSGVIEEPDPGAHYQRIFQYADIPGLNKEGIQESAEDLDEWRDITQGSVRASCGRASG